VCGVDADPAVLVLARGWRQSGVTWVCANPTALPFAAASVDKVLAGRLSPPSGPGHDAADDAVDERALREAARVLRPGGRLVVAATAESAALAAAIGGAGLVVAHQVTDEVALRFAAPAGEVPAVVRVVVHYATATTPRT
jgi:ubiquinone/menaquinone biosynthesis C-methylase UbiE